MSEDKRSLLITSEDYWAIWIGFAFIIIGLAIFLGNPPEGMKEEFAKQNKILDAEAALGAPFKTVQWYEANDAKEKIKANSDGIGETIKTLTSKIHGWKSNPLDAFYLSEADAKAKQDKALKKFAPIAIKHEMARKEAITAQTMAASLEYSNQKINEDARQKISDWREINREFAAAKKKAKVKPYNQIWYLLIFGTILALIFGAGNYFMEKKFLEFIKGFAVVFFISIFAYLLSTQALMKSYGLGYALWAILIGLIISNTVGTPKFVRNAAKTEYFIKTGLVLMGVEILFGKILQIGLPGIFITWFVTPVVLVSTYIFGQKVVKMKSKTLNMTISADMSVCGVSAAIATAAACKAKKEELTLAVGLSLIFTSIMMVIMPLFIKAVGIPEILGGAWMGGTIDATGAVAAAGAFLGEKALYVAATIKMIQNVLIGVISFFVALYFTTRVEKQETGQRPGLIEIWNRFPKFVIGFAIASIVASGISALLGPDQSYTLIDQGLIRGMTKNLRGWMFCLAFVSIGLSTNFRELKEQFSGGKPLILYVCGQSFNLILTLTVAYIMFYIVFPAITEAI